MAITLGFQHFRAQRNAWPHDARVARDAEEPAAIVGHSPHAHHASECTVVCGTGQPPRLTIPLPYFVEIKLAKLNKEKHSRRLKLMKYTNNLSLLHRLGRHDLHNSDLLTQLLEAHPA
jgi:hypothetical protein